MGDRHLNKRKKSGHPRSYEVSYVCIGETDSLFLPKKRKTEQGVVIERERECVFFLFFLFSQEGGVTALTGTALSVSVELNERGLFYCIAESLS